MSFINVENLNYIYPEEKNPVLKDISFTIEQGEIVFLIGKSGSGKSSLGKCLTGAIPNFYGGTVSGDIYIDNENIRNLDQNKRAKQIGMVFQDPEKQMIMNKVHREIAFGLENIGFDESQIKRRVFESLQFSNILDLAYRDIESLSGGEKQKVAITSVLAYLPKCIILDEVTSQLDPSSSYEVMELIKKINIELGITIIIIEQKTINWFEIADKIFFIEHGENKYFGDKKGFYKNKKYYNNYLPDYLQIANYFDIGYLENKKQARNIFRTIELKKIRKEEAIIHKEKLIEIKKLKVSFEKKQVIRDLSLDINKGEFFGIIGSNGAGKTTLLKTIMGIIKYNGTIKLNGKEIKNIKKSEIPRQIAYISQNPNDYISKDTVYDEIKFTLDNYKIDNNKRIDEILKQLDIFNIKDKNPRDLSGGETQRVAIAAMIVLDPEIIILDEPTRGLDSDLKEKLGDLLVKLNNKGTTIILVTHDIEFTSNYCNKFMLLINGEMVSCGSKKDVLSEGIFYTTNVNKLFRDKDCDLFNINDVIGE
ncbi:MAG: ABC transporter ATP-binding protein [Clostridiaceae bacterium]